MARFARKMTIAKNDLRPVITGYVQEEDTGEEVDLTAAISAGAFMYPLNEDGSVGAVKIDDIVATIPAGTDGKVTFAFTGSQTDTGARYAFFFVIYWGATKTLPESTTSILVHIKEPWERWS